MKKLYLILLLITCAIITAGAQTKKKTADKSKTIKTSAKAIKAKLPEEKKKVQTLKISVSTLQREELENQRKEALKEIELTSQLLAETRTDAANSLNRLNLLTQQLAMRRKVVFLMEQEVMSIDRNVKSMNSEIEGLERNLAKIKDNYAKSMQTQQQERRTAQYKMLIILSADNLSQSYRRMRYLKEYSDWQREEASRIVSKQNEINKRKEDLEKTRKEKLSLITQRTNESKKIEEEEVIQQKEVSDLNRRQKDLQSELQRKQKDAEALNSQIEQLITEDIKNSGKNPTAVAPEQPAKESEKPKVAETKPEPAAKNYAMTESEVNLSKDFASNKGRLPYPVAGSHTIVSSFGEHQHQELSYVRTNNNGIDIQTTAGTDARAIFKGVVTRIFVMPGFNYNVIVRHGNYLTVYSNISQVYVKAGDVVNTRQAIGKIYTDKAKNETILHFQIWKERTKLNPAPWIK